ncbi:hypothetical protein [Adhaeribacter soli]|uniref:PQQ-binding-like beta-propeller repeat protein n=1 Tax=Adhaeribacter soli TaxID=2607655 RepID=A0A5N1IUE1_9BACT|nr:hypothetical protein [Adhaeribacter soli]KAA9331946.1 hypothetical protein F0P94_14210 [Adhaeribacter soli]
MKWKFLIIFACTVFALSKSSLPLLAQTPALSWSHVYGNPKEEEFGHASVRLNATTYLHGGSFRVNTSPHTNPYLVFTDLNGNFLGDKVYQNLDNGIITGLAVNEDGTFVACGLYTDSVGSGALFFFKADQAGNIIWRRSFTGALGNYQKISRLPDGYLLISSNQVRLIKTDLN